MLIDIINQNAEQRLLSLIEQCNRENATWGALHFYCSRLAHKPIEEDVLLTIRPVLEEKHAAIYFFYDGDIIIAWNGMQKATLDSLTRRLYERYAPKIDEKLHQFYDVQAHGEDLRLLCKHKIDELTDKLVFEDKPAVSLLPLTPAQIAIFRAMAQQRAHRKGLNLLLVEDQAFSRKLLLSLLERICTAHAAADAEAAMELYYTQAPDMVFLDIELPDVNGHDLAAAIHALDKQAYIVMVTGNNHWEDVERARANGAKGFIVKPYSKGKIMESIEKFIMQRKLNH